MLPETEPWPDPVDGAELLRGGRAIRRHIVLAPMTLEGHAMDRAHVLTARSSIRRAWPCPSRGAARAPCSRPGRADPAQDVGGADGGGDRYRGRRPVVLLLDEADAWLLEGEDLRAVIDGGQKATGAIRNVGRR